MSMNEGGNAGRAVCGINVTPLIDVLLVLLIIFIVIVPVTPNGLGAQVPQPPKHDAEDSDVAVVIQVNVDGSGEPSYLFNQTPVAKTEIVPKLKSIFIARPRKVMFVKGDGSATFAQVAELIDFGHRAGADSIGLLTPGTQISK